MHCQSLPELISEHDSTRAASAGWTLLMRIAVVGMGHVGLVTAVALSAIGHNVIGLDSDEDRIIGLFNAQLPFYEPGLKEEMARQTFAGRLWFCTSPADAYPAAEVVFICVGTPPDENGAANLIAVERAALSIYEHASDGCVVVEKSTVPCGTHQRLSRALGGYSRIYVASNPEFLREGTALMDTLEPSRIVVGTNSESARLALRGVYQPIIDSMEGEPFAYIETDIATAELAKNASNAMLATKISFMNLMARICEAGGADVTKVAEVMGADPRIGPAFLDAGIGFGGFCFPKDVAALAYTAQSLGCDPDLLNEVLAINQDALLTVFERIKTELWHLQGKQVGVLGLAFKPDTDDTRFSPAVELCRLLIEGGATVVGWDPQAGKSAQTELPDLILAGDPYIAAEGSDLLVIATEWPETADLDIDRLAGVIKGRTIVDGRNMLPDWKVSYAETQGFKVFGVGRLCEWN
jgi:UDPglucose 6-dehydrogenase